MTKQLIHGACPHDCPDTCGFITEVENGRAVNFYGDPKNPVTQGWLCAKVRPYLDHVYHPDRLTHPLKRVGPKGSGQWQQISWAEALATIAGRWQEIIANYGAEAILPYSYSGTLGMVQMSVTNGRFWNRLGASQLERSICGAAAEYAVEATLGARHSQPYTDLRHTELIIIWGHNPASAAPHFMPHLKEAQRRGCTVIVIDPRRTRTARTADLHLAPRPNTDGVLALGLAHIIVKKELHNPAWLEANTVGWPQLRERLVAYTPEKVAAITGLSEKQLVDLAQQYAAASPSLIKIADGLQRHLFGGQTIRAVCALPAITGQYGTPGGGLAYSTSGTIKWDGDVLNKWDGCPPPGRVVNMNRLGAALTGEVSDPPIKSLVVFGSNPAAIAPNAGKVIEGLKRDDLFTVVHELFMTDTADYADIVLPATSQLEHVDLHKGYGHTLLTYNRPAIAPLAQCKSNWEVMGLLAGAMGFTEPHLQHSPDEIIVDMLAAMAAKNTVFEGITLERLQSEHAVPLNLPSTTPFADLRFPTPSGKVELFSERLAADGHDPIPGWPNPEQVVDIPAAPIADTQFPPLHLVSGAAHHFTTSSFANQPTFLKREGEPFIEINPADAEQRGIKNGDLVAVENNRGGCKLRAVVTNAVRPGVVASPKGRWAKLDPFRNGSGGRNINWTTSDELGDMGGQSAFHSSRVWICKA